MNAPDFNPDSGGAIFLHELVHALNELGETAYLWPMAPIFKERRRVRLKKVFFPPKFVRNPALNTPLARKDYLEDPNSVAIYPEIVPGNPMGTPNVVRWLLYKPGDQHPYSFTDNEMFFCDFEKADMPELTGGAPLLYLWKINRAYRNEGRTDRKGVCYIVRKGQKKPRIPETETAEAIDIDGMSHAQINDIFNRCEVFYSYDEATMYSQFAALCGCLSIVIPGEYETREDWVKQHVLGKYGIAYGSDPQEIAHARATVDQLVQLLEEKEQSGLETVKEFIQLTRARFAKQTA
ncbi:MAG: hypothetical protein AAGA12_06305 [Pseudomonadota bacterium]